MAHGDPFHSHATAGEVAQVSVSELHCTGLLSRPLCFNQKHPGLIARRYAGTASHRGWHGGGQQAADPIWDVPACPTTPGQELLPPCRGFPEQAFPTSADFLLDGRGAVVTEWQKTNPKGLMQLINSTGL